MDVVLEQYKEKWDRALAAIAEVEELLPLHLKRRSFIEQVREFHTTFGVDERTTPGFPSEERIQLRGKLITEEYAETMQALGFDVCVSIADKEVDFSYGLSHTGNRHLIEVADGICDMHVVLSGTSLELGLPEDKLFAEVHRSNMSKAEEDGTVHKRADGKILKAERWSPPNIQGVLDGTI